MSMDESITNWIGRLGPGSDEAAQRVWMHYHSRLLGVAARALTLAARGPADEEDVVASAFESFFKRVERGDLPPDAGRDDLWRFLAHLVKLKAASHNRHSGRLKRGGGVVPTTGGAGDASDPLAAVADSELTPDLAVEMAESVHYLTSLLDDQQRRIAALKLEGHTDLEVALELKVSKATVERRLTVIRDRWKAWLDGESTAAN